MALGILRRVLHEAALEGAEPLAVERRRRARLALAGRALLHAPAATATLLADLDARHAAISSARKWVRYSAVASLRAGAYDFLTKPVDFKLLVLTVERAIGHRKLHEEVKRLRLAVNGSSATQSLLGQSSGMRKVYDLVARIATTDTSGLARSTSTTWRSTPGRTRWR